jgi:hypothetical protein
MISEGKAAKLLSMNDELSVLDQIRVPLLEEAKNSPLLLSDLAGLEQYIAESYDARSFIELLQNADDAGATRFLLAKHGNVLSRMMATNSQKLTSTAFAGAQLRVNRACRA